jgi:hypothetical protein
MVAASETSRALAQSGIEDIQAPGSLMTIHRHSLLTRSCNSKHQQASHATRQNYPENIHVTLHPANYFGFRETTLHAELLEHPVAETNRQRSSRLAFAFKFTPKHEANLSKGSCA